MARLRLRLLFLGVMTFTVCALIFSSHMRHTHPRDQRTFGDFYEQTKTALSRSGKAKAGAGAGAGAAAAGAVGDQPVLTDLDSDGDIDDDDARLAREMAERLRAAEQQAKDLANAKSPNKPDAPHQVVGVGSSASGQKKDAAAKESDADHTVEVELNNIFKVAPVIIFSKSYCPYSKRAKGLLLQKYTIEPAPFVVELDLHPLGAALQARLAELTGRRTVPNILVSGKSIGGSDDIVALDSEDALVEKIKSLAGKRVEMTLAPAAAAAQ